MIMKYETENRMPLDLVESLIKGKRQIKTALGNFSISGFHDLRLVTVVVPEYQTPHTRNTGFYCALGYAPALSYPRELQLYGIPVWLPVLRRYGYWDEDDTQQLFLYPDGVTWQNIEADLPYYVGIFFNKRRDFNDLANWADIVGTFDYVSGNIERVAKEIVALPALQHEAAARDFIDRYELVLTAYPLSPDLYAAYPALVSIYISFAEFNMSRRDIKYNEMCQEVIRWLERCVVIIDRFKQHDLPVCTSFSNTLMRLSLWHSNAGNFKAAQQFCKVWKEYDPSASKASEKLLNIILMKESSRLWQR